MYSILSPKLTFNSCTSCLNWGREGGDGLSGQNPKKHFFSGERP